MHVEFSNDSLDHLDELSFISVRNKYFSYFDHSFQYVSEIINFVQTKIYTASKHPASSQLSFYRKGLQYIYYKRNKRTTWYIFFFTKR